MLPEESIPEEGGAGKQRSGAVPRIRAEPGRNASAQKPAGRHNRREYAPGRFANPSPRTPPAIRTLE